MASIAALAGKRMSKEVTFLNEKVTIFKLSSGQVEDIRAESKRLTEKPEDTDALGLMRTVIAFGVEGGADISEDDFKNWPIDDVAKLSEAVMEYSGLGQGKK